VGAVRRIAQALIGRPDALPEALAQQYPELTVARYRRGGVPLRIGGWCLGAATVSGITLWRTIWLDRHVAWDVGLLLHEVRHVQQFQATPGFPLRYIWETLRRGYRQNRFEVDARRFAARRLRHGAPSPPTQDP
jgi:hypothetical protein